MTEVAAGSLRARAEEICVTAFDELFYRRVMDSGCLVAGVSFAFHISRIERGPGDGIDWRVSNLADGVVLRDPRLDQDEDEIVPVVTVRLGLGDLIYASVLREKQRAVATRKKFGTRLLAFLKTTLKQR